MEDETQDKEAKMMDDYELSHMEGEDDDPFGGATSFEELEAAESAKDAAIQVRELSSAFVGLTINVMNSDAEDKPMALASLADEFAQRTKLVAETKERWQPLTDKVVNVLSGITKQGNKPTKLEGGVRLPAEDFAYVGDPQKPDTWKLPLAEGRPGNITVKKLGNAAAAFSSGGFRGQRVQIPADAVASVKARIRREYRGKGVEPEDIPASVKEVKPPDSGFTIKQLGNGRYRWTAIYSNNYRDDDNPPEIISAASHRRFEKMVDAGEAPYPELWYWHNKDWKLGVADFIAWDDLGFAIASGLFDESAHGIAEKMLSHPETCSGVSHGMSRDSIKRSGDDPSVIVEHITHEISPLPIAVAANKLTGFILDNKEADMAVSEDKKAAAEQLGLDLDEATAKQAETAADLELESKEQAPEPEAENGDEVKALRDEVTELVKEMGNRLGQLVTVVEAQQKQLAELTRTDAEKIKEQAELTPAASLTQMFKSAIGAPEAKMDGRKARANEYAGPTEADPLPQNSGYAPGIAGDFQRNNAAYLEEVRQ